MAGRDVAGLALDVGAERDRLVAGGPRRLGRRDKRIRGARDNGERSMCEKRIAGFRRLHAGIVEQRLRVRGKVDRIFGDDGLRVGELGRIGHGRAGCDGGGFVARHIGDGEADEARGLCKRGETPALDARKMLAHAIDLADDRARPQQRARDRLFFCKRERARRRDPIGRAAARHERQHEIVGASVAGEIEDAGCRIDAGLIRHGMTGFDNRDDAGGAAVALPCDAEARQPVGGQAEPIEIMRFRSGDHRARRLAGGEQDDAALRRVRQMAREQAGRMSGGDGCVEQLAQSGARVGLCVGHRVLPECHVPLRERLPPLYREGPPTAGVRPKPPFERYIICAAARTPPRPSP